MAEPLTPQHFLPYVEKTFRVAGGHHAFILATVDTPPMPGSAAASRQPFNLIFRGPAGDVLVEGIYMLEVEGGPSFELYVMPIHTPDRTRQDYQSAFN